MAHGAAENPSAGASAFIPVFALAWDALPVTLRHCTDKHMFVKCSCPRGNCFVSKSGAWETLSFDMAFAINNGGRCRSNALRAAETPGKKKEVTLETSAKCQRTLSVQKSEPFPEDPKQDDAWKSSADPSQNVEL